MLLRDLKKVWISEYEESKDHGEKTKIWKYKGRYAVVDNTDETPVEEINEISVEDINSQINGIAYLNIQQDISELDRKSTGEIDYSIENARTTVDYNINKGDGISLSDISNKKGFVPDFIVTVISFNVLCCAIATPAPSVVDPLPFGVTVTGTLVPSIVPPFIFKIPERISIPVPPFIVPPFTVKIPSCGW